MPRGNPGVPRKTRCKHGHALVIMGRNTGGACNACIAAYRISSKGKAYHAAYMRAYSATPAHKLCHSVAALSSSRKPESKATKADYEKRRCSNDPAYKLKKTLRTGLGHALRRKQRTGSAVRDLGCSIPDLIEYFQPLFQEGMSWENHGKWHIDHIVPLSAFDLTDPEQLKKACHFTNLQPLWAKENLVKGAKQCE